MTLRPAPGQQLAAGRLRVDATKAIAKLREYQLVDRTAWILEAIRAAVAAGAAAIDLQGDSNDVWLSWTGTPWPADDLPRLFDELVSPEPGAARHHVRLLAAAVNSALGANPAYVDIYAIGDDGAVRARYTPDVLEAPTGELEESPLRRVQAQVVGIPHGASKGMHVHFRRRASLEVVSYWLRRADPPELVMARSACADIATPIQIGDVTLHRETGARDVVRVPLGDDLDGWIAITDTTREPPRGDEIELAIAERGVRLETTTIDLGLAAEAPVPLRVVIDAPRMPTNASRSEVRRDAHPVATAERRARELVPAVIAALAERCRAGDASARHAALHLLASAIAGSDWARRARDLEPPLRALAELPLVRDAAGTPRPVASAWSGLVHAGDAPLPAELAPWLSQVLWAPPDDPTSALVTWWIDKRALDRHLKRARRERRAEKRFYKHAPREPRVLGRRKPRVRARLGAPLPDSCIPDSVFADLAGEVCVYTDRRGGELVVLLGGRDLETVEYDSALGFAAAIDSPRVKPAERFRGAVRNADYAHVERAMRAGVVRAIEAVALARAGRFADGHHVAVDADEADDVRLFRAGLALARELGASLSPAFEHARIWSTTAGPCSLAELRAHPVLGVVPPRARVSIMDDRLLVYSSEVDRALLAQLVPARFVPYEPGTLAERLAPVELAELVVRASPHALAISDGELVGAIVPAEKPSLQLYHRGRLLADTGYTPAVTACTIAVDSDRLVPHEDWSGIADDAGLGARGYATWEQALARATALALVGDRPLDLIGVEQVHVHGELARWLWRALIVHRAPAELLGEELATRLRTFPLLRVLGEPRPFSIDELAVMFPETIAFVEHATDPVPGMPVVVAEALVARGVARLAGRKFRNAAEDLARRRVELARELRLAQHRTKPVQPLEVAGTHVPFASPLGRGVVGVARDAFELQVLVEGRPFQTITRVAELPIACVVELADLDRVDERFEVVHPDTERELITRARAMVPALLRAIAERDAEALADPGPRRTLLATFVAQHAPPVELREALARTIRFSTVQGGRATLLEARRGPTIQTCAWSGEWLGPDGDPHALDRPVLLVTGVSELATILGALGNVVDVTPDVETLQAQRRIARGLLPRPRVTGAEPGQIRQLADLGPSFRHLGPGEIALVGGGAEVLLHVHGELRERVAIACEPPIQLAIEAAELLGDHDTVERRIGPEARALAILLARQVLRAQPADTLPAGVRHGLRRAILAGRLEVHDAPVFETQAGAWIDLAAVQAQRELFGDLWSVPSPGNEAPLDERRLVLVLPAAERALANEHGIPVIDATEELVLDARTRRNRARAPLASLALEAHGTIGRVELPGDGVTAVRGTVAVLAPDAAHHRGLRLARALHPFDDAPDPCRWPTLAILDDARFTPDRCWAGPAHDEVYKAALDALHRASNEALRTLVSPPADALVSIRVAPWTYDAVTLLRGSKVQIRGALWLDGPPLRPASPAVRVVEADGERLFVPLRGSSLTGTLYVHATEPWPRDAALEALAQAMHGKLVRELAALGRRRDPDLVAAHVAWALALERILPADAKDVRFGCFRPGPIDAAALHAILMASAPVTVIPPESTYDGHALLDDGSEAARVIKTWLGSRLRAPSTRRRPDTVEPPPRAPDHPLQPFVNHLHARMTALGVTVPRWRLVDGREEPLARFDEGVLELGANHRHLIAIAAALAANTAWARDALDAMAAHCITVLNIALTSITDATEARAIGKLLG